MRITAILLGLALWLGAQGTTTAYSNTERSLDEKVTMSDVVVVGTAASVLHETDGATYAVMRVEIQLKGNAPSQVQMFLEQDVPETDPHCCTIGHQYLLFLSWIKGNASYPMNRYRPVNGQFGVYDLTAPK